MMRKTMIVVLAGALALGACAGPPVPTGGGTATITLPNTGLVAQVVGYVQTACGFRPLADTVLALVGTFVPGTAGVATVGDLICSAVTTKAARLNVPKGQVPVVRGVPIQGTYIR